VAEKMREVGFKYRKLTGEEKERLLNGLRKELDAVDGIVFAYVHGGFIEMKVFRDVDVAVWIKDPEDAFSYEVDLSAKLEANLKTPIDLHVLNQAPLSFKHHAFTRGKLLFSKDEETRIGMVDETVRQYADIKKLTECARQFS
jgi:predicted nucleotidyltransferase